MTAILQLLQEVQHPAKGDRSIVDLGMVEKVEQACFKEMNKLFK
jgi:metal-sulfur cluster biosynthetic enzyme